MSAYLKPGRAPIVEASAINGAGVTATLRAAVAKILDNLKNNVDTTLHDEPPLAPPDMTQRVSGTAPRSPLMEQAPFTSALELDPIESAIDTAVDAGGEDDPFGAVAVAEPEHAPDIALDTPFAEPAAQIHDAADERTQ